MTAFETAQIDAAKIRTGVFAALPIPTFAVQFQTIAIRDGLPRTVCLIGNMPVLQAGWAGSGYRVHHHSFN